MRNNAARCDGCGYVYDDVPPARVAEQVGRLGERFQALLVRDAGPEWDRALRQRPMPHIWSPLEYACHVRDVLLVQRERVLRVLFEHNPVLLPMHRDDRVDVCGYNQTELREAVTALMSAAGLASAVLSNVKGGQWQLTCTYPFPEPKVRTLAWLAHQTLHEGEHHLLDIERGLEALA